MNLHIQGLVLPNGMPVVIVEDPTASEIDDDALSRRVRR
jgi:hypothetical protein